MRVSEIRVKQIRVNQGLGVLPSVGSLDFQTLLVLGPLQKLLLLPLTFLSNVPIFLFIITKILNSYVNFECPP